jgi:hypothetical protein
MTNKINFLIFLASTVLIMVSFVFIIADREDTLKCQSGGRNERIICWSGLLQEITMAKGANKAMAYLSEVKETDVFFSSDCHVYAHLVGEISYWQYRQGDFEVNENALICGSGFYHGFMQEMGHHDPDFFDEAPAVCNYLSSLSDENKLKASNECTHGIGHGIVFALIDVVQNDEAEIAKLGISYCRKVFPDNSDSLLDCIYGMYGGISSIYFGSHGYLWPINWENPFWVCDLQPKIYQKGCYGALVPAIFTMKHDDLPEALRVSTEVNNIDYARETALRSGFLISHPAVTGEISLREAVFLCQSLAQGLGRYCIQGIARGVRDYSLPKELGKASNELCNMDILNEEEKEYCIKGVGDFDLVI